MPEVTNWHQENGTGEFTAIANKKMDLDWWAKEIQRARQLTLNEQQIKIKLASFNNISKNHLNDTWDKMKVGVYCGDHSLYLDVTGTVNALIQQAVQETNNSLINKVQWSQTLSDHNAIIFSNISEQDKSPERIISAALNSLFSSGMHIANLYFSGWVSNVRTKGKWDFKNNTKPFSKVNKNMSPFFWYNGYHNMAYKLEKQIGHKPGLLRYDDPGNICYGATGKLLISAFDNNFEKWVLTEAAEIYAMHGYKNSSEAYKQRILEQGGRYDDPHDIAAIKWGYESPFVPNKPFLWEIFLFYKNKIHRR